MANGLWCGCVNDSVSRQSVNNARITVTDPATGNLLGLFSDREGTKPLGNPFLTREDGLVKFYCRAGRINIDAFKNGTLVTFENEVVVDYWEEVVPPIVPAGSYWRINVSQNNGDANLAIAELHFIGPSGWQTAVPHLTMSGAGEIFSSEHASSPAWHAFDGDPFYSWMTNAGDTGFIGYNFGFSTEIIAVSITVRNVAPYPARSPQDFVVESSDDGVNWTTRATITNQTGWATTEPESRIFFLDGVGIIRTFAELNAGGGATISGNGQIVTTNNNALDCARSDLPLLSKTYIEIYGLEVGHMIGVCNENSPFNWSSGSANCAMYYINTGGNFGQLTGSVVSANLTGGFVGLAIDPATKKLWIREIDGDFVNGDPVAGTGGHAYTGLGGTELHVAIGCGGVGSFIISAKFNFGEAGFFHAPPAGYGRGLYVDS